jgi:WhiB family redox-sensing transcriptional regulator
MRHGKYDHENLSEVIQPRLSSGDDWRSESACLTADPDIFFPDETTKESVAEAKSFCGQCKVQMVCLDFALRNGEKTGVFGGLDENERKPLARGYSKREPIREVKIA